MTDRCDVAVVGGGIAGLVAAAEASRAGARVALVDAHSVGGRARTAEYRGLTLNQGPHAVYRRGALMQTLTGFGIGVSGGVPALEAAQAWVRGQRLALPTRNMDMARSRLLRTRSKLGAKRVFDALKRDNWPNLRNVSLAQFLDDQKAPHDLRAFVEAIARLSTYANAPDDLSAEAFAHQYAMGGAGVLYLDGGWQQIVDAVAGVARKAEAKILDHRGVLGLDTDGIEWIVHTDAGDLAAPTVVLAVGLPAEATRLVGEDLGWVDAAGPPVRAACLDLGLSRQADAAFLLGIDEPYYLSTHSPPARLAPDGIELVSLARYLRADERLERDECEAGLWQHAVRAGISEDAVVARRYLHEMVVAGGLPLASRGGFAGRPSVVVSERRGLYLAGDWVGTTGMIGDAAASSGAAAARAACARLEEVAA